MTKTIYCAVDTSDHERAMALTQTLSAVSGCGIKLGLEYFSAHGAAGVRKIRDAFPDMSLFLDIKYHDIPNTVAQAYRALAILGVDYINLHASGGSEMMKLAHSVLNEEADKRGIVPAKILAVTVLTSLDDDNLNAVGQHTPAADQVLRLARLTQACGLAGVVCSAHEIKLIRKELGRNFVLMVPGIRPAGSAVGDQKRVMTPAEAFAAGATHLVVGRPITGADDPAQAAAAILADE